MNKIVSMCSNNSVTDFIKDKSNFNSSLENFSKDKKSDTVMCLLSRYENDCKIMIPDAIKLMIAKFSENLRSFYLKGVNKYFGNYCSAFSEGMTDLTKCNIKIIPVLKDINDKLSLTLSVYIPESSEQVKEIQELRYTLVSILRDGGVYVDFDEDDYIGNEYSFFCSMASYENSSTIEFISSVSMRFDQFFYPQSTFFPDNSNEKNEIYKILTGISENLLTTIGFDLDVVRPLHNNQELDSSLNNNSPYAFLNGEKCCIRELKGGIKEELHNNISENYHVKCSEILILYTHHMALLKISKSRVDISSRQRHMQWDDGINKYEATNPVSTARGDINIKLSGLFLMIALCKEELPVLLDIDPTMIIDKDFWYQIKNEEPETMIMQDNSNVKMNKQCGIL
ncbi:MAG: hypothetical protein GY730_09225 [bacterium]|nr:hypothetical protein [bacterium]